jgi:hypothetical protein
MGFLGNSWDFVNGIVNGILNGILDGIVSGNFMR